MVNKVAMLFMFRTSNLYHFNDFYNTGLVSHR